MADALAVRGVVLAGGASTRFGDGEKALATLDGRPLVAHVVGAVAAATDGRPILAVADERQGERLADVLDGAGGLDSVGGGAGGPDGADERSLDVETVVDTPEFSGPLAGLFAAVERADVDWLFACACDMPLVTPAGIAAVREAALAVADGSGPNADGPGSDADGSGPNADGPGSDAVVPVVDGHDQPLHAIYRRSALEAAREALSADDALMAPLDELDVIRVDAADLDESLAAATTNVNTRADLDALRDDGPDRRD